MAAQAKACALPAFVALAVRIRLGSFEPESSASFHSPQPRAESREPEVFRWKSF
jgi:hypothetical protein